MIQKLLSAVHKYYPIGCPEIYGHYDGIKNIKMIVIKKITEINKNRETPHTKLVKSLEKHFPQYKVSDAGFFEFPSYFISMEINNQLVNGIKSTVRITVVVSLLINLYTIYLTNNYNFLETEYFERKSDIHFELIYFKDCKNEEITGITRIIEREVKIFFSDYEYIHHFILFDNIVKSGRTLIDLDNDRNEKNYCYYDYLFSIDKALKDNFKVLF